MPRLWHAPGREPVRRSSRPASMPTPSRHPIPATLILAALVAVVAACGGSATAPQTGGSAANAATAAATPVPANHIDHPIGRTDIVLRVGEEGGFMMMEWVMARVPRFTLYGDGRVLISAPAESAKAAPGTLPTEVLRETHLSEDEVQAVLRSTLVDGKVGVAKEEFPVMVMDVPTTIIELQAGGVAKRIAVAGLGMEPPPGPDAAVLTALARLVERLVAIPTDADYAAPASVAVLAQTEPAPGSGTAAWPWPETAPAAFVQPPQDAFGFATHLLTPDESEAIGTEPGDAAGPFTFDGPDGKAYVVVVRPALPEEAAA
jgi:hypothetical protein